MPCTIVTPPWRDEPQSDHQCGKQWRFANGWSASDGSARCVLMPLRAARCNSIPTGPIDCACSSTARKLETAIKGKRTFSKSNPRQTLRPSSARRHMKTAFNTDSSLDTFKVSCANSRPSWTAESFKNAGNCTTSSKQFEMYSSHSSSKQSMPNVGHSVKICKAIEQVRFSWMVLTSSA